MKTLLQIKSSLFGDQGNTSALGNHFVEAWQAANPDGTVRVRDLSEQPEAHLSAEHVGAFFTPEAERNERQQEIVAHSDALIDEVREADLIVLGVPMYNFAIPSQLKSWLDQLARAGVTFKYTENGPVGLIDNKPVVVFAARGGVYADTPNDNQVPFLKQFLGFIGLSDVTFVFAEGVNMSGDHKDLALAQAKTKATQLLDDVASAA
ncbi:FMN-dependent NADH-azoreductase [Parahaliea maris]|uniref:FMN dependent NADH:quinone oxidoreductase n=1 Tax=Parahaliea maris TaxID=2716870 RepID=A0A5C9A5C1_9GAMM|nr:NAD(P)H-dependent oxidoreductase [Parahaliea maris]TXS95279.1 FMN-dependent NADH-azoreductase [Parahaliea maris]